MATAVFTVCFENNLGEFMEFEYEYDFHGDASDFDPADPQLRNEIFQDVMRNMYYDMDFVRLDAE
jgi:hypothetical protein